MVILTFVYRRMENEKREDDRRDINFDELLKHFEDVQTAHTRYNRAIQRANQIALSSDSAAVNFNY